MKVKELRAALVGVDDDMEVLLRIEGSELAMGCPHSAEPDAGCSEVEWFTLDANENECPHGLIADHTTLPCEQCLLEMAAQ